MSFWKKLFRGVAAIAIPYVAPAIGSSLNALTGLSAFTTGAGQIATGAGLGALAAGATGGDWRTGALIGGAGTAAQRAGLFERPEAAVRQMFSGAPGAAGAAGGVVDIPERMYGAAGGLAGGGTSAAGGAFLPAVQQLPGAVASRLGAALSPERMADMTLRAVGYMAGSALAGSGLSPEEEQMQREMAAALQQERAANQQLFNQRVQQAMDIAGGAKYFDPTYIGLQSARRTQTAMGRQAAAGVRSLAAGGASPERIAAERRRAGLDIARATGTAFDTGFGTGVKAQAETRAAGLQAMPTEAPSSMAGYSQLAQQYTRAAQRKADKQATLGGFGAELLSPTNPANRPKEKKPEDEKTSV